jgi:hypothetical protein
MLLPQNVHRGKEKEWQALAPSELVKLLEVFVVKL